MKRKFISLFVVIAILAAMAIPVSALEINVDGEVIVIDTEVYKVTLPTSTAFTFTLDPQGLLGIAAGATGALTPTPAIKFSDWNPIFLNQSSRPIKLGIELQITTADDPVGDAPDLRVVPVATADAVTAGDSTAKNVFVQVTTSTARVSSTTNTFAGTVTNPLAATANHLFYVLPAADYVVKNTAGVYTYELEDKANNAVGTQIGLDGIINVNTGTNWVGNEKMSIKVKFAFNKTEAADLLLPDVDGTFGFKEYRSAALFDSMTVTPMFMNASKISDTNAGVVPGVVGVATTIPFDFAGKTPTNFRQVGNPAEITPNTDFLRPGTNTIVLTINSVSTRNYTFEIEGTTYSFGINVVAA